MTPTMVDARGFFESRLRRYGDSPRTLGWSPEGQRKRFEVLVDVGDVEGQDIFDIGCGLGHIHQFLTGRFHDVSYRGVDTSPKLISRAQREYPHVPFAVVDAVSQPLPWNADYVFASGVLNMESGNNKAATRQLLRTAFLACRHAVAVNMLSTWADWTERNRHYCDPIGMVRFARRLTPRVVLRHDYMPHDFTLYLYRGPTG